MANENKKPIFKKPETIQDLIDMTTKPERVVVTAGMPYANGPIHIGHLAGAHIPPDVCARYHRMLIGNQNVLFVTGTDDHGSNAEVAAVQKGVSTHEFIASVHDMHRKTFDLFSVSLNNYTGTSVPETYKVHEQTCHEFIRKLYQNGMLEKKSSMQWYDPKVERFLPDRYVYGTCPNENCGHTKAYSNECDSCGANYQASDLKSPHSALSDATPELRETDHLFLDMWKTSDVMRQHIEAKKKTWRKGVYNEVINTIMPCLSFTKTDLEDKFSEIKKSLPKHKSRFAPGKKIIVQFENLTDLEIAQKTLDGEGFNTDLVDGWAHRSVTRDVTWGVSIPKDVDPNMEGKSFYVWPDSLIAPISFSKIALEKQGRDPEEYKDFWKNKNARVCQFLGQDNVFFYVLMQGAMWVGSQDDPYSFPKEDDFQLTDIYGSFHLQIDGEKMSKSVGNFYTGDELISDRGYSADQIRYQLCLLSLADKTSNFDFKVFEERNAFLAGPMNAAFEKPISACIKKFDSVIPEGELLEKAQKETFKIVQKYLRSMEKAEYSTLLFAVENYGRIINGFFAQYKPHDDRQDKKQRADALYSCFYILKNLMIMLYPFVPETMDKLRQSLNLGADVFSISELAKPIQAGHKIGEMQDYFPAVENKA